MEHKVLILLPAFNEEGTVGNLVRKVPPGIAQEVIVWDDGSTDNTRQEAQDAGGTVKINEKTEGIGSVIKKAIKYAIKNKFDIIVVMAANGKDDPAEVPRLIHPIINRGYDFIQGSRYLPGGKYATMPYYRLIATKFLHPLLITMITRRHISDSTNGFRAYRLSIFKDKRINIDQAWLDGYEFEYYLLCKVLTLGYRFKEVPVSKIYPTKKTTKIRPVIDWWHILKTLGIIALQLKN